jgi:hypothetical protein
MDRLSSCGFKKITRVKFTAGEDVSLRQLVDACGTNAWPEIASRMGTRTVRQCRDRWNHYLSTAPGSIPWTNDEDTRLLQMVEQVGVRWKTVAGSLPQRSETDVKQRWFSLFRVSGSRPRRDPELFFGAEEERETGEPRSLIDFEDDPFGVDLFSPDHKPFLGE